MSEFVYSLRLGLCPDFYPEEKFEELLDFCRDAKIDDIQFFMNMEEVNDAHLTPEETKPWLDMLAGFKDRVKAAGMTFSLNPWITTLHTDRGRKLKPGQNFTTMVDYLGNQAEAVACPKCGEFDNYLYDMYQSYAKLGFDTIWVEDDFRLHNHLPLEWGGCFCRLHMADFAKRIGHEVSREEFYKGVTAKGAPHEYRKVWLDSARDTMVDFAKLLGDAVHSVAPDTRVALMSSGPETHCSEGRDWDAVLGNLSGKNRPLDRPHLPAYNENTGFRYCLEFQRFSRLTAHMVPENTELWPELDNLPHTTFSKSHRFAQLEIESALSLCSEGITINIFDMIGNGIAQREHNDVMLRSIKPYLNSVMALGAKRENERGVCVMFCDRSSYTVHADDKPGLKCIEPMETFWAEYLSAFGIANHYCKDKTVAGQIVAICGQYLRNLTEEEIRSLFAKNTVLLTGDAVEVLLDLGLGELAGAEKAEWYPLNGGRHSYEQVADGKIYHGLKDARMSSQAIHETIESCDYLNIDYTRTPHVYTQLKTQLGQTVGQGLCRIGNVIVFPYGHMLSSYMPLLNPVRRELLAAALREEAGCPALVYDTQYVTVNDFAVEDGKRMLLLTNYATDTFEDLRLFLPYAPKSVQTVDRTTGELVSVEFTQQGSETVIHHAVAPLSSACFIFEV